MTTVQKKQAFTLMVIIVVIVLVLFSVYRKFPVIENNWSRISKSYYRPPQMLNKNSRKNNDGGNQKDSFDSFLQSHPLFKTFNVSRVNTIKKRVHVLIIISTAPKRRDRRDSIRRTWWKRCLRTTKVYESLSLVVTIV